MSKTFLFQAIQFCQTVLIQTIQFNMNMQISSIWLIDRTLSGATTQGYSGPGSNGIEWMLHIPQNSSITRTWPSDCLLSYSRHSLWLAGILPLCRGTVSVFYSLSQLVRNKWSQMHLIQNHQLTTTNDNNSWTITHNQTKINN